MAQASKVFRRPASCGRGAETARDLMLDLEGRLANRVQMTTDGNMAYVFVTASFSRSIAFSLRKRSISNSYSASRSRPHLGLDSQVPCRETRDCVLEAAVEQTIWAGSSQGAGPLRVT